MTGLKKRQWSKKEIKFLRNNWSVMTGSAIAQELGRKTGAVYAKAISLGIRKYTKHKVSVPKNLGNSTAVQQKLNFNEIKVNKKRAYRAWSLEEEKMLMDMRGYLTIKEISKRLNRTTASIFQRINRLNHQAKAIETEMNVNPVEVKASQKSHISTKNIITAISVALNMGLAGLVAYFLFILN